MGFARYLPKVFRLTSAPCNQLSQANFYPWYDSWEEVLNPIPVTVVGFFSRVRARVPLSVDYRRLPSTTVHLPWVPMDGYLK